MSSEHLSNVRRLRPVVHTITNYVTANDCANLLLAAGASPIMADAPEELRGKLRIQRASLSSWIPSELERPIFGETRHRCC